MIDELNEITRKAKQLHQTNMETLRFAKAKGDLAERTLVEISRAIGNESLSTEGRCKKAYQLFREYLMKANHLLKEENRDQAE